MSMHEYSTRVLIVETELLLSSIVLLAFCANRMKLKLFFRTLGMVPRLSVTIPQRLPYVSFI